MDFTGARREAQAGESQYFRDVAEDLIATIHPTHHNPLRSEIVASWRNAGYRLATHLLPSRHKRFPDELNALLAGARQAMQEYEVENLGPTGAAHEEWNVDACEKLETNAARLLKLATHENTPPTEARNAALALAKIIASSELVMLGWERVRHFSQKFQQMKDGLDVLQEENPLMFLYSTRDNH